MGLARLAAAGRANPLALYAVAYAGSASLQKGLGFLLFIWLARALPVEQYAQFGLLFALQTGLTAFASAGIIELTIAARKENASVQSHAGLYARANLLHYALAAFGAIVSLFVYRFMLDAGGSVAESLSIVVCGALTAFFANQAAFNRLEENHARSLAIGFLAPVAGLASAALAFWVWRTVPAFFIGTAAGLLVTYGVLRQVGLGYRGERTHWRKLTPLLIATLPYIAITILVWLGGYGNTYFVDAFFDSADVARFTFAYTLSSILQLVATSLNQVWSPQFFNSVGTQTAAQLELRNLRFYRLQGLVLGACGALVVLVLPYLLEFAGGNLLQYRTVGTDLTWLFAGYALSIPWWHAQNYFLVHGQGRSLMYIVMFSTFVGIAVWLLLMQLLGVIGIYVGFMVQMLIRSICIWIVASRSWSLRLSWQGPALALLLLLGARVVSDMLGFGSVA
jgi:O-antigen/teichoic acid export membrane protein